MIAGVVLAAGASTRLGRPKGLVGVGGEPLLRRTARVAVAAGLDPVVVVLGAHVVELRHTLIGLRVRLALNAHWSEGMASSIRVGLSTVERVARGREGVALLVADQVALTPSLIRGMAGRLAEAPFGMVAASYDGRPGTPAIFAREHFPALARLEGDVGARDLLRREPAAVSLVPWDAGRHDLDRPADLLTRRRAARPAQGRRQ